MKNRVLAMLLALVMLVSLCACAAPAQSAPTAGGEAPAEQAKPAAEAPAEASAAEESYNIKMQIVTFGQQYSGITDVENAINAIVEPEIGVTVTLEPIAAWDLPTQSSLSVTSGEKLDVMCILSLASGLDSVSNYTSKNMLLPLDDVYAQYGADIANCVGPLIELGYSGGSLYAVPVNYTAGAGQAFLARTDLLKELNIEIDNEKYYTPAELSEFFAAYKAAYGDGYYAIADFDKANDFHALYEYDNFGDFSNGAVVGDLQGTTVVNPYETKEFSDYLTVARGWYESGYYNPDCVTITDTWTALVSGGNYFGAFASIPGDGMDALPQNEAGAHYDLTPIRTVQDYATTGSANYCMWAIPVTCETPEKVMQFLNILYQERDLATDVDTLLACGIEGKTYKVVEALEGSKAIITYVDGVDNMTSPYQQAVPVYGNQFTTPQWAPLDAGIYDQYASYNKGLEDSNRFSACFGYSFDPTPVSAQKSAVQAVIAQYEAILVHGAVDPTVVLPEFLSALEAAGYDEVIAENQRQLNEWLSKK